MYKIPIIFALLFGCGAAPEAQETMPYDRELGIFVVDAGQPEIETEQPEQSYVFKTCDMCKYEHQMCTEALAMMVPVEGDCQRCKVTIFVYGDVSPEQLACASTARDCVDALRCW